MVPVATYIQVAAHAMSSKYDVELYLLQQGRVMRTHAFTQSRHTATCRSQLANILWRAEHAFAKGRRTVTEAAAVSG